MESIHEPRHNRLIIRGGVFRNFEPNSPEKPPRFAVKLPAFSKASVSPDVVCSVKPLCDWALRLIVDISTICIRTNRVSPPNKPGPRYVALLQLLRTADTIWNSSRVFFGRWDLSPAQFNLLNLLTGPGDGLTQSELSRELLTHRSNITGLVDRLEARGLVARHEEAGDRRAWRVVLTAAGRRLMDEVLPHYFRAAERVWEGVPARRAAEVGEALRQVATNTEQAAARLAAEENA